MIGDSGESGSEGGGGGGGIGARSRIKANNNVALGVRIGWSFGKK